VAAALAAAIALRTASRTRSPTIAARTNRTSVFAGWTLTSTSWGGSSTKSMADG